MKLASAIREFVDYKRSLGMVYVTPATQLRAFLAHVGDLNMESLSQKHVETFLGKSNRPVTSYWFGKYQTLKVFFGYAISRHYMNRMLLPISLPQKPPQFLPYIFSRQDVKNLLGVPDCQYRPNSILTPATMRSLLLLLYGTGMRLGETIRLRLLNVNLEDAWLKVEETKFYKSRFVPIGPDLVRLLTPHCLRKSTDPKSPLFFTRRGRPLSINHADHMFEWLRVEAGVLRTDGSRYQPRLHDFRHTFAVTRLVSWYREGKDVQRLLPYLSTYLGHVHISSTAHYLTMTQELLEQASLCFERYALGGDHA